MKPPVEPKAEDCCDSGCNPCIFDVYEKQIRLYKLFLENGDSSINVENSMCQLKYTQFNVLKSSSICEQHSLLLFKQTEPEPGKHVIWRPGEHFLVKYQCQKGSCSRAYTPIKFGQPVEDYDFAIIVKRYANGLVSNYLCNLKIGESCFWRGPYGHYQLDPKFRRLIMIAQGTGIAPMYSIIKHILNDDENMTKVILLYCCKSLDTILMRDEFFSFKSYWNFEYVIYVSNYTDESLLKYKEPVTCGRLTDDSVLRLKPNTESDQFLLCGSNEFMEHYSGILQERVPNVNIVKF